MRDFSITEQDIAISKARREPEFRVFAERSSRLFLEVRRLPIYDVAVSLAREWLNNTVVKTRRERTDRSLLIVGDDHTAAAAVDLLALIGLDYTHIFPDAC
ncbi:MAG: hypothetical protein AAF802_19270 [Planctomycetota bacterium]